MEKLKFAIENVEFSDDDGDDSQFVTAKIDAFSTGRTRHDTTCNIDNLKIAANSLYEKPIIFEVENRLNDFGSHNDGKTIPAGFVVPGSAEFREREDGRTTVSVIGKIWRRYSGKFIDIFKDGNTKTKKVSVEIEVYDAEKRDDGLIDLIDFSFFAICVLGDFITEASPGAKMTLLSFAKQEADEYKKAFIAEFGRYDNIDFTIPDDVRQVAQAALDERKKMGRGGTSVSLAMGKWLISSKYATPEKIKRLAKYFGSKEEYSTDPIAWGLMGGTPGAKWSASVLEAMLDNDRKLSYFGNETADKEMTYMEEEKEEEVKAEGSFAEEEKEESKEEEKEEVYAEESSVENEKEEEKEEEEEADEKEDMAFMPYSDVASTLAFLQDGSESYAQVEKEFALASSGDVVAYSKILPYMAERMKAMAAEMESLKTFKLDYETEQFDAVVTGVLEEVRNVMPESEYVKCVNDSKNYSYDNVTVWANAVKAKAFAFAKNNKPDDGINRIALPFDAGKEVNKKQSLWD